MTTISIGLLLPSSSIRPSMGKDFEKAFSSTINHLLEGSPYKVEIFRELIGQGSIAKIEEGLNKFFGYEDVDVVVGITSNAAIKSIAQKFEKKKVPVLINNLGEHFISSTGYNDFIFMNSIHLWQQCYLLGHYAVSTFGKRGLLMAAMYDGGYAFHSAFDLGMRAAANDTTLDLKFLGMPANGELSDVKSAFDQIDMSNADFVFGLFCGEEATIFLEEYNARGLSEKLPLLGLPFLLEPGKKKLEGTSIFTPKNDFDEKLPDPKYENVFSELGILSGSAIGTAILKTEGKIQANQLAETLKETNANRTYQSNDAPRLLNPMAILKNTFGASNKLNSECVHLETPDLEGNKDFSKIRNMLPSSWLNPYLSV